MKKEKLNQSVSSIVLNIVNKLLGGKKALNQIKKDPQFQNKLKDLYKDVQELKDIGQKYFKGYQNWE